MAAPLRRLPPTTTARGEVRSTRPDSSGIHGGYVDPKAKYARVVDAYIKGKKIQPFSDK